MAITIVQSPYTFTPLRQRLIVLATSDNIANAGFQYKVEVEVDAVKIYEGYHPPNPANALVFDVRPIIEEYVRLTSAPLLNQGTTIHSMSDTSAVYAAETTGNREVEVIITEAWLVNGALTDDPDTDGSEDATMVCVWPASYQYEDGYRPNPSDDFAMDNSTAQALTDRTPDTHTWPLAESKGFTPGADTVFIPVFEEDYGTIGIPICAGTTMSGNIGTGARIAITIHKADGSATTYTANMISADNTAHVPCYPANINDSGVAGLAVIKPSANPGWVALSFVYETTGGVNRSQTYVLYNAELYGQHDCRYPRVRLAWANSRGDWDYFNFIKKSEQSVNVERRRYRQIPGNYGTANGSTAFTTPSYSRGLKESKPKAQRFIDITTDWISEGEFELLKWLVVSDEVQWIQDDGTSIPVVVETNEYVTRRSQRGKVFNQTFRLRLAHDLNV